MKFRKEHIAWILVIILIIVVAAILIVRNHSNMNDYREVLDVRNDSISILQDLNIELELQLQKNIDTLAINELDIIKYQDSIDDLKIKNIIDRRNYERKIADIIAIPTDSLYRDLTRWLDNQ